MLDSIYAWVHIYLIYQDNLFMDVDVLVIDLVARKVDWLLQWHSHGCT